MSARLFKTLALGTSLVLAVPLAAYTQTAIGTLSTAGEVTIEGEVKGIWGNNFVVSDASGDMLVEGGPSWYHKLALARGDKVSVTGRMDGGSFEALRIRKADGAVIDVRPASGPPPWAGRAAPDARGGGETRGGEARGERRERAERGPDRDRYDDRKGRHGEWRGLALGDIRTGLAVARENGVARIEEVEVRERNLVEVEGWRDDGTRIEIRIDPATREVVNEKRDRRPKHRDHEHVRLSFEDVERVLGWLADNGYPRVEDIGVDRRDRYEIDAFSENGAKIELKLARADLRLIEVDRD